MRSATASVTMVDGGDAVVQVFQWKSGCCGHRWLSWHGAPLYWDGSFWRRDCEHLPIPNPSTPYASVRPANTRLVPPTPTSRELWREGRGG
jgi:hypothetical protein